MTPQEYVQKYRKGQIFPDEAAALVKYMLASTKKNRTVVEIGIKKGKTTALLGNVLNDEKIDAVVVGIDPYFDARPNIAGLIEKKKIVFHKRSSLDVAKEIKEPVGLVFLDGCHCEACCYADIQAWRDLVMPGGFLIFHDVTKDGVPMPEPPHAGGKHGVCAAIKRSKLDEYDVVEHVHGGHMRVYRRKP